MKKINLEEFPMSESAKKMLSYVSDGFYDESYVGKWIFQAMGKEYDKALEIAMDLPAQFYPETATWGLMYHEIKWGLPVWQNLPYEERRRLIFQKRDYRAPMTPYRMEKYLADATGLEVQIADVHDSGYFNFTASHPNIFKVVLISKTEVDFNKVEEMLNKIKQSHTMYTVEHRKNYERCLYMYATCIVTEWIGYEIKSNPVSRNMDKVGCIESVMLPDTMIFEEIMRKEQ